MKERTRRATTAVSLALGLGVALGLRLQADRARQEQRHDAWMAYVRGPLALYVQGSREGARALLARPGRLRSRELVDAAQDLGQALAQAAELQPRLDADPDLERLDAGMTWLTAAQQLSRGWAAILRSRPDQVGPALAAAEALRGPLDSVATQVWIRVSRDSGFTPSERAEVAAELSALARPLPRKAFKRHFRHRLRRRRLDR